jgi:GT2 family glycosyltransferase
MPPADPGALPVSVVVPTVGRPELLERCLASLGRCRPRADEVLVVDQSAGEVVAAVVAGHEPGVRLLRSGPPSIGRALNAGLEAARYDSVLVTHDDCVVRADWVGAAAGALARAPQRLITGQVLPGGADPRRVPSTKVDPEERVYAGWRSGHVLYPNNMAFRAARVRDLGGFDVRLTSAAEDNDFCYRWLRAGREIAYDPRAVVTHEDWRTPEALAQLYRRYWRAQGRYYAKHLRRGDLRMLAFLALDARLGVGAWWEGLRDGRERWTDPRRGLMPALLVGLLSSADGGS